MSNMPKARAALHTIADRLDRAKKTQELAGQIRDICEQWLYRKKAAKKPAKKKSKR